MSACTWSVLHMHGSSTLLQLCMVCRAARATHANTPPVCRPQPPTVPRGGRSLRGPGPAFTTPGAAPSCLSWRAATDVRRRPTSAGASLAWWDSASSPTALNQLEVHPAPNAPHPAALHDDRQLMKRVGAAGAALPRAALALGAKREQNQRAGAARRAQLAPSKVVQDEHT